MADAVRKLMALAAVLVALIAGGSAVSAAQPPWATGQSRAQDIQVKLVTFSPGDEIVAWFGHTALVVEDTRLDRRRLYNYGMFSFDDGMLAKFAMGRLWFWVGQAPVYRTYEYYKHQHRDVRIATLNLAADKRLEMARGLAKNVLPENRDYLYQHYYNNCSTRIRDAIDAAVDGQLHEATAVASDQTLRDHTRRHAARNPPMEVLLMFLENDRIDQPIERWDELFLPEELEEAVVNLEYTNQAGESVALVNNQRVYYHSDSAEVPDEVPTHWPWVLAVGLILGAVGVLTGRYYVRGQSRLARVVFGAYNALLGTLIGVPGLGLAVMWCITDHKVTYHNENLFLGNPLTFLALPLGLAMVLGSARASSWLRYLWVGLAAVAVVLAPMKLLPSFDQVIVLPAVFIYPILAAMSAVWFYAGRGRGVGDS